MTPGGGYSYHRGLILRHDGAIVRRRHRRHEMRRGRGRRGGGVLRMKKSLSGKAGDGPDGQQANCRRSERLGAKLHEISLKIGSRANAQERNTGTAVLNQS